MLAVERRCTCLEDDKEETEEMDVMAILDELKEWPIEVATVSLKIS